MTLSMARPSWAFTSTLPAYAPDKSELQIQGESVIKALADAGLSKQDVDGLFTASSSIRNSGMNLADYLNMYPKYVDNTTVGGRSFEFHLSHALPPSPRGVSTSRSSPTAAWRAPAASPWAPAAWDATCHPASRPVHPTALRNCTV